MNTGTASSDPGIYAPAAHCSRNVRTYRGPHLAVTRRDAVSTAVVCAVTRSVSSAECMCHKGPTPGLGTQPVADDG